jgi:hypothetical protein
MTRPFKNFKKSDALEYLQKFITQVWKENLSNGGLLLCQT